MELIDAEFRALAGPPSLATCTRDVYADGERFSEAVVLRIARAMASVAGALHAKGILHGDLYAHNVLRNDDGHALLGDFGAASFYPPGETAFERLEVLSFGRLLGELLDRCPEETPDLRAFQARCESPVVFDRPSFADVQSALHS
jgi:serine/threonine protein kinase